MGLHARIKGAVRQVVGGAICRLAVLKGYKRGLLASWQAPERRGPLGRLLFPLVLNHWFQEEYLREPDPDKREDMKALLMGGTSGKDWAAYYDAKEIRFDEPVGSLRYAQAYPLLADVDARLNGAAEPAAVVQVGSSSGRELAWLAQRHPRHRFIGTDIYSDVIAYAEGAHRMPNLSFQLSSAREIDRVLRSLPAAQKKILISSGSFQYVQPEHLGETFAALVGIAGLEILLQEPGNELEGSPLELRGSAWRGNFSYTHNYRFYSERAGFVTSECRLIKPYEPRSAYPDYNHGSVHYYYVGRVSAPAPA